MAASYIECQHITVEETCDLFHFNKIITFFSEKYTGVIHAGNILSQNLVLIGDSVCLYPLKFSISREVGETDTRNDLNQKFNLFQSLEEVSYYISTLLRALSLYNNRTTMFFENFVCKYIQTLFTTTNNNWKDSFTTNSLDYIMLYLLRVRTFFYRK